MNKVKLMEILARIPLFKELTFGEREMVLRVAQNVKRVKAGRTFMKQGAYEPFFYIILAGEAKVSFKGQEVGVLKPGDFIGEVGFICNEPRSASVAALSDMVVVLIRDEEFRRLPSSIRESIKDKIISGLMERLSVMNKQNLDYRAQLKALGKEPALSSESVAASSNKVTPAQPPSKKNNLHMVT